jgi:hypothetical protein
MKIAVIGGTGVFGERLVGLLVRDGHDVVAVGRGAAALAKLTTELGVTGLVLDRAADLSPLWALAPDVVVDAAGPFHAYGSDPYRLPRAAIAHKVNYLDLADDAAFCAGIATLDAEARAAGVFALSGVSSVPGLSSCVVTALTKGMTELDTISTAILPGNRAPRGQSVMHSILHQTGTDFLTVLDGKPQNMRSWSRPAWFTLAPGMTRQGWMIEVPDQRLFPTHFRARTVEFRAGMELRVMNYGLAALSWLRVMIGFGMPRWLVRLIGIGATILSPFGTDRGGMIVTVTGRGPQGWLTRRWTLVVRKGEGPFIPAVMARAILRDVNGISGAGPALGIIPLARVHAAMDDLAVTVTQTETPLIPQFQQALGADFQTLSPAVRATHDHAGPRRWSGLATVTRGTSLIARIIAAVFRFPAEGRDVPITVLKTPSQSGEIWDRRFGHGLFRSHLRLTNRGMTERFGLMTFTLHLHTKDGALHYPVVAGSVLGLPLPRFLLPQSIAREYENGGKFQFDVALIAPLGGGLIVQYNGFLTPDGGPALPV